MKAPAKCQTKKNESLLKINAMVLEIKRLILFFFSLLNSALSFKRLKSKKFTSINKKKPLLFRLTEDDELL